MRALSSGNVWLFTRRYWADVPGTRELRENVGSETPTCRLRAEKKVVKPADQSHV